MKAIKRHIHEIYTELQLEKPTLTEAMFSCDYLGRSKCYYSYVMTTENDASEKVLLNLWGQLRYQKLLSEKTEASAHPAIKLLVANTTELYSSLSQKAFQAINERAMELAR